MTVLHDGLLCLCYDRIVAQILDVDRVLRWFLLIQLSLMKKARSVVMRTSLRGKILMAKLLFKSPAVIILLSSRSSVGLIPCAQRSTSSYSSICRSQSSLAFSRRSLFITAMAASTSSMIPAPFDRRLQQAITLLDSIYSSLDSSDFPLPMSPEEAGPCTCISNAIPQRRYLWTDAFAVLAYQTISDVYSSRGHVQEANLYTNAADKLIDTVHNCLGKPRSGREEDAMKPCKISPTGYVGIRIGKVKLMCLSLHGIIAVHLIAMFIGLFNDIMSGRITNRHRLRYEI
jgi:hypothetical protein